jgi:hypothetical protein
LVKRDFVDDLGSMVSVWWDIASAKGAIRGSSSDWTYFRSALISSILPGSNSAKRSFND